jgi:hypothetical protein
MARRETCRTAPDVPDCPPLRQGNRGTPHRLKAQKGSKIKSSVRCKARTKAGLCRTPHRCSI